MKKTILLGCLIILITFLITFLLFPKLPDQIPSHWNTKNEVDNYMSKTSFLFLMPTLSFLILVLFVFIPKIDPLKKNISKFKPYFSKFILIIILFLTYIHFLTLFWVLNYQFSMAKALFPALAIIFYYAGVLIKNAKQNWFIGIRTPWTLSNKEVWKKTHNLGSKVFKISALIILIGLIVPNGYEFVVFILAIILTLYPLVYSYFEYIKINKK